MVICQRSTIAPAVRAEATNNYGAYVDAPGNTGIRVNSAGITGEKLTVGIDGSARGRRRTEVNGIPVAEDAPVLGIALSAAQDGFVWVLINPQ